MHITTYTEARQNLKSLMDKVCNDADITIITRKNGEDVVMMSRSEYSGIMETMHLNSSPENAKRLKESIANPKGTTYNSVKDIADAFGIEYQAE